MNFINRVFVAMAGALVMSAQLEQAHAPWWTHFFIGAASWAVVDHIFGEMPKDE